jgi:5-methylcytosine-specific restriction protein A
MALKAFRTCGKPGCPALIKQGSHCAKHAEQVEQRSYETKKADEVWMLYQQPRWKKFRLWFWRSNPQCQRVIDGVRCEQIATTIHHRISPRQRPDLFIDADNVKAVCTKHHSNSEGDRGDEVYAESNTKLSLE